MYSGAELNFELQPWADVTAFKEAIAAALSKAVAFKFVMFETDFSIQLWEGCIGS